MPQMRAISAGISEKGRPSQNLSKPRNCGDVEAGLFDVALLVEVDGDLGVALDAADGVDDDFLVWAWL